MGPFNFFLKLDFLDSNVAGEGLNHAKRGFYSNLISFLVKFVEAGLF